MTEQRNIHDQSEPWQTILQRLIEELVLAAKARDRVSTTVGKLDVYRDELPKDVRELLFEFSINELSDNYQVGDTWYDLYYSWAEGFRDLLVKYGGHVYLDLPWHISEPAAPQEGDEAHVMETSAPLPVEDTIKECGQRLERLTQLDPTLRAGVEKAMELLVSDPPVAAVELRKCREPIHLHLHLRQDSPPYRWYYPSWVPKAIGKESTFVYLVGCLGAHTGTWPLQPEDVLPALVAMIRVLEWWDKTGRQRTAGASAHE